MQGRNEEPQAQEATSGLSESHDIDDTDSKEPDRKRSNNVDELPDGSGTDRQSSAADHGQENGRETFDAG